MRVKQIFLSIVAGCMLLLSANDVLACGGGGGGSSGGGGDGAVASLSSSADSVSSGGSTSSSASVVGTQAQTVSVSGATGDKDALCATGLCSSLLVTIESMMEKLLSVSYGFAAMEDSLDSNSTSLASEVVVQMLSVSEID
ncbi:MAG: hypothetical protein KAJ75_06290 [Alphaproteobacteria bacterium]|nr:hypothetical protein [Alphaproteobacteria bacterium]